MENEGPERWISRTRASDHSCTAGIFMGQVTASGKGADRSIIAAEGAFMRAEHVYRGGPVVRRLRHWCTRI